MEIIAFGLNHKTAPVGVREKLSFKEADIQGALLKLKEKGAVSECLILSTCNRVELYAAGKGAAAALFSLRGFLRDFHCGVSEDEMDRHSYALSNKECVRHLFSVSSGLDSMVIGETEILGQVKCAYEVARSAGATGKLLNLLFQKSFKVAKCVRTSTAITAGALSVGSVAVELAGKIFKDLGGKRLLIFGAGKMSEVALKHLLSHGISSVIVSNRSYERALELADKFNAKAMNFEEGLSELSDVDIVISATSSPHYIIRKEHVLEAASRRRGGPIFFIDIAVPRDVDPSVNEIDDVYLYNIDDLKALIDENLKERQKALAIATSIVDREASKFMALLNGAISQG